MPAFLSNEWLEALGRTVAPPGTDLAVQVAVASVDATLGYGVVVRDGAVTVHRGTLDHADVTLTCDEATGRAMAEGRLGTTDAFMAGRLRIAGDVAALLRAFSPRS